MSTVPARKVRRRVRSAESIGNPDGTETVGGTETSSDTEATGGTGRDAVAAGRRPGDTAGAELSDVVSRLRRAMRRAARAADPGSTLSVAQLELLSCLAEQAGARPGQLARLLKLAPSSVATLINGLRSAGLVIRDGADDDRRTARIWLTPEGEAAVARWKSVNEELLRAALASLPAASGSALLAALPALRELAGAVDALADESRQRAVPAGSLPRRSAGREGGRRGAGQGRSAAGPEGTG
jgi:DNA-binding MarR family transcriptional regulator